MNKRGGVFSLVSLFILVLVVIVLSQAQHKVDTETITKTIDSLNWTRLGSDVTTSLQASADNSPNPVIKVLLNILNKAIDLAGYCIIEVAKLAMQVARDNPNIINYKVLLALILLSLLAPLIYPIFIIIVSLILIIKEYFKERKEKKELRRIETLRELRK